MQATTATTLKTLSDHAKCEAHGARTFALGEGRQYRPRGLAGTLLSAWLLGWDAAYAAA